jgi:hypothetical protein
MALSDFERYAISAPEKRSFRVIAITANDARLAASTQWITTNGDFQPVAHFL